MELEYLINHGTFKREQFTFYRSWFESLKDLPDADRLSAFDAIARFALYGEKPKNLTPMAKVVLTANAYILSKSRAKAKATSQIKEKKVISVTNCNTESNDLFLKSNQNQNEIKPESNLKQDKDKGKDIDKDIVEKNSKKRTDSVNLLEFVSDFYKDIFQEWLDYKRARGQTYKTEQSLKICYNKLVKLSHGDPEIARLIIEDAIANNYQGFFELKNYNNGTNQQSTNCYSNGNAGKEERDRDFAVSVMQQLNESKGEADTKLPF